MRVLFTTQPGSGHWRPLAPLARTLQAAGHQVAFATTPDYSPYISMHGFDCFPTGVNDPERDRRLSGTIANPTQSSSVWVNLFIQARATEMLPDVLTICDNWGPNLVIREISEFGGWLAAEHRGIPHVAVQVSAFRPHLHQLIAPSLNRLRDGLDLPPDPNLHTLYRFLLLSPLPSEYHRGLNLPSTALAIQNVPFDEDGTDLPGWIADLADLPTVYASLGTAYNQTPGVFEAILEGLRDEPINLIMTVGEHRDPSSFGPQPAHVHIERYIPQSLLFPNCQAVITHGGFGTVTTALAHALPMVIIPVAADQPDNAQRCAGLGLARIINPAERTPAAIREALRDILATPRFRHNARRIQAQIGALPKLGLLVGVMEQLVKTHGPTHGSSFQLG